MPSLAIVIPAYKAEFLDAVLRSLAAQTDRNFTVYVGDDAGPDAIRTVCDRHPELAIRYTRFDENLGGRSLAGQWNRCVALAGAEPWVWLFSDDDILDSACMAALAPRLRSTSLDLLRFNTVIIDREGGVLRINPVHPAEESGREFLLARFGHRRISSAVEYVFRREAFDACGGFEEFPFGWCSDDATWLKLAGRKGIGTVPGPTVSWRMSGANISSRYTPAYADKVRALSLFLLWVQDYNGRNGGILGTRSELARLGMDWFTECLRQYRLPMTWRQCIDVARLNRRAFESSGVRELARVRYLSWRYGRRGPGIARRLAWRLDRMARRARPSDAPRAA